MKLSFKRLPRQVIATKLIMVIIVSLLATLLVLLQGCGPTEAERTRDAQRLETQKEATEQVSQGATNLAPIGQHLETSGRSPEGQAVLSQVEMIRGAIKSLAKTLGFVLDFKNPTVSYAEWAAAKNDAAASTVLADRLGVEKKQMETVLAEKDQKLAKLQKVVDEEEKQGWWRFLAKGAFWSSVAGIGVWVARILNVPGIGILADPLLKFIGRPVLRPVEEQAQAFSDKAATAATAVMASDVARFALGALQKKLDPSLSTALAEAISRATGGKATSLEGVFKMVAKGVAIDEGQQVEVDSLLDAIRAEMPTKMGEPEAVAHLFKTA